MIAQLKLKTKLILLALVTSVLLIIQGGYGEVKMGEMADRIQVELQAIKSESGAMIAIENAQSHFKTQVQEWKNILIRGNDFQSFDKYLAQFDQQEKKVQVSLNSASGFMREVGLPTEDLERLKKEHLALGASYRDALKNFSTADANAGKQIDAMVRGIDRATTEAMNTIVSVIEQQHARRITAEIELSKESYVASRNAFAIMVVLGLLLAIVCATVILRDIMRQLGGEPAYAVEVSRRIARGDLTVPVNIKPSDNSSLLAGMCQMQNSLIDLVRQVHQVSGSLSSSAQQVHAATQHVAVGSEMQNETASSMAAAVEEVTVSISHVASNANDARSMALDAGQVSDEGRQIVKQVISEITDIVDSFAQSTRQIEELGAQSAQISTIALVIKEVADQTNLLALNAAIEAARAGEQGRGFAVVADEVRKLAERTTKSTREIAEMITTIQEGTRRAVDGMEAAGIEVEEAVVMAAKAEEAMSHIESSARQVLGASTEISEALNEQTSASALISQNVASISNMVEVNTSAVKEVVSATEHLEKLARELVASVDRFQVEPAG